MRIVLALLIVFGATAQDGSRFKNWAALPGDPHLKPKMACGDLRSLTTYEFSIIAAEAIAASSSVPEHCRVTGLIPADIRFEVNLPASWNKRLYMFGNGGFAGENPSNRAPNRTPALERGFVVTASDTGHDNASEPLATFAVNRQKLLDYAFRSQHITAATAKRIAQVYYGDAPSRSYYDGCSTGGRQGLILAQRFPDDFDGIVVGAPVLNFTGTMTDYVSRIRALAAAPIPEAKLPLLASRIYELCDAKDGLKDGLIDDPRKCEFSPQRDLPKCSGASDDATCFTAGQIETLTTIYSDKNGFPGWPVGAEAAAPNVRSGWLGWIISDSRPTISKQFAESFFRYMAFPQKDPVYDLTHFDFDKDRPKLEEIHRILDATETDLSKFKSHGGKILMYYGWADPALNPMMGVGYYEGVRQAMGASTSEFFRLFMVPGMFHCAGGPGPSSFDPVTPLVRWVEQRSAPERIVSAQIGGQRSRPLCPYPEVARYKGTGSVDDAVNFTCQKP